MANLTGKKFGGRKKGTPNKKTKDNFKINNLIEYRLKTGLYILKTHNFFKIGISSNLHNRITMLNNMNPYGVEIVHIFLIENPSLIEKQIHTILNEKLINGKEWFKLNQNDVNLLKKLNTLNIDSILNNLRMINKKKATHIE